MATLKALQELSRVVEKHHAIVNACMVDFVTKDIFSVINPDLANELLEMSEAELQSLPQLFLGRGQVSLFFQTVAVQVQFRTRRPSTMRSATKQQTSPSNRPSA